MIFKKYILNSIKKTLAVEIIFSLLYTLCIALIPYMQKLLFDSDSGFSISYLVSIYILLILGSAFFQYISQYNEWKTDRLFNITTKNIVFKSIFGKPYYDFKEHTIGDYITITNDTIEAIEEEFLASYVDIIKAIVQIIIYMVSLILIVDYRIAIIIIIASLISVIIPKVTANELSKRRKEFQDKYGYYTDVISDFYTGHTGLDDASKEGITKFHETILIKTENQKLYFGKFKTFVNILNGFIMDIVSLTAFITVGILLYKGEITVGSGVATFAYIESFIYPIKYILNDINAINASKALVGEVNDLGEDYLKNQQLIPSVKTSRIINSFQMIDLYYKINDFKFGPVSFEFEVGKRYLVVGTSGSGKSTLLKLFSGQINSENGKLLVDEIDISDNASDYASNNIMCITQSSHVFSVPFLEQVTHFKAYSDENLNLYLNKLPSDIFNRLINCTNCKELSGGEQQVINILTCLLAQKPITLIDEGLSAMDYKTKEIVRKEILSKLDTSIYIEIAHSIEKDTISYFDYVLEFEKGRIVNVFNKSEYIMANFK